MFRKSIWFLFFIPLSLKANSLSLDSRFEYQNTQSDLAVFSGYFKSSPLWDIDFETAGRVALSSKDIENWSYGLGGTLPLLSFASTTLKFSQENFLGSTTAFSSFLFLINLHTQPFVFFKLELQGGWYRRFVTLNKSHFLPALVGANYSEHDFAVSLAAQVSFDDNLSTVAKVATFEEISVYNLNHPYIETHLAYESEPSTLWKLYARYQLLLGFGRMDNLKFGLNLTLPLS